MERRAILRYQLKIRSTIGRSRRNRIRIDASFNRVSGEHLRVDTDTETVRITDLKSTNGTFVGKHQLSQRDGSKVIRPGEQVTLGGNRRGGCLITLHAIDGGWSETDSTARSGL